MGNAISVLGMDAKDAITIIISVATLIVTVIANIVMMAYWNRRKLSADLKSKSRIEWIQKVRNLTAELLSNYYQILSYETPADYKFVNTPNPVQEKMLKAMGQQTVASVPQYDEPIKSLKSMLSTAQEKSQLLMLYYGAENTVDPLDFILNDAEKALRKKQERIHNPFIDENDGKNEWMSGLINYTYELFWDEYGYPDEGNLNFRLEKASKEFSELRNEFIVECRRSGLIYDTIKGEAWKATDDVKENPLVDEELLNANNRMDSLDAEKKRLEDQLNLLREVSSIYLKHEWDRAKKGK